MTWILKMIVVLNISVAVFPTVSSRTTAEMLDIPIELSDIEKEIAHLLREKLNLTTLFTNTQGSSDEYVDHILLTRRQAVFILESLKSRHRRKAHKFKEHTIKWTLPIPYSIGPHMSDEEKSQIRRAISHWQTNTCIRFKEISGTAGKGHLLFKKSQWCASYVGLNTDIEEAQSIDVSSLCIRKFGPLVHEIGHAIGFWHEHNRSDRKKYIRIVPKNAAQNYWFERELITFIDTHNLVPYDYGSIMHYPRNFLSINMKPTIETVDPLAQFTIGQRTELSFYDAKTANLMYCSDKCKGHQLDCKRSGYADPNDCSRCRCPDGFTGRHCDGVMTHGDAEKCGGSLTATAHGQEILSPNYYTTGYEDFDKCTWFLKANQGQRISVRFLDDFLLDCSAGRCDHWVEVRHTADLSQTGARFCCMDKPNATISSTNHEMMILFRANFSSYSSRERRRFKLTFSLVSDGKGLTEKSTEQPTEQPQTSTAISSNPQNVIFVLDSSGSVKSSGWNHVLGFVRDVIKTLDVINQYKVAIVSYGYVATIDIELGEYASKSALLKAINTNNIPWKDQSTNTAAALHKVNNDVFSRSDPSNNDDYTIILITDGPEVDKDKTITRAKETRNLGIRIIPIVVGDRVEDEKLKVMVSNDDEILRIDDFTRLAEVFETVSSRLKSGLALKTTESVQSTLPSTSGTDLPGKGVRSTSFPSTTPTVTLTSTSSTSTSTTTTDGATTSSETSSPESSSTFSLMLSTSSVKPSPPSKRSVLQMELAFVLDSSTSVKQENWPFMLHFVKNIVSKFSVSPDGVRVGIVTFGYNAAIRIKLEEFNEKTILMAAIDKITYSPEDTHTAAGIEVMRRDLLVNQRNVPVFCILVTDGRSTIREWETVKQAKYAKDAGISMFAVGVGGWADAKELNGIASEPKSSHVLRAANFSDLPNLSSAISSHIRLDIIANSTKDEVTGHGATLTSSLPTTKTGIFTSGTVPYSTSSSTVVITSSTTTPSPTATKRQITQSTTKRSKMCGRVDVVFLLDSSGSVKLSNWPRMLLFVREVIDRLPVDEGVARAAVVTFGNHGTTNIRFTDYMTKSQLLSLVNDKTVWFKDENTNTADGLSISRTHLLNGSSDDARKVIVLITDGPSTWDKDKTIPEAKKAHRDGTSVIAVGVGKKVDKKELKDIAGESEQDGRVELVNSFMDLIKKGKHIASLLCNPLA